MYEGADVMELRDCRFHWSGDDFRFSFFSDGPCRAQYLHNVLLPIAQLRIEVYEIKPGVRAQWVVVQQRDGESETCKLFVKTNEGFQEKLPHEVPSTLKSEILRRFPRLTLEPRSLDQRLGRSFQSVGSVPSRNDIPPIPLASLRPSRRG